MDISEEAKKFMKTDMETEEYIRKELEKTDSEEEYPFSPYSLRDFLGKDFIAATRLPQHSYMLFEDAMHERVYSYYPKLWKEVLKEYISESDWNEHSLLVEDRVRFINSNPSCRIRWLSFLNDNKITKDQFYENFGITVTAHYRTYLMQLYHSQGGVKDTYGEAPDVIEMLRYQNSIKAMAKEVMRELYLNNLNMACAGSKPASV